MKPNRFLVFSGYLMAGYLVLAPLAETLAALWPFHSGDAGWRYGATGLVSQSLMTPLLGLLMAVGLAVYCHHWVAARLLAVLSAVGGVVALIAIPLFTLDALQVRGQVPVEQGTPLGAFGAATVSALLMMAATVAITFALARGAWAGTRGAAREARHNRDGTAASFKVYSPTAWAEAEVGGLSPSLPSGAATNGGGNGIPIGDSKRVPHPEIQIQRWGADSGSKGP
jgi:hypothetical protein